jgi:hypothetical protein
MRWERGWKISRTNGCKAGLNSNSRVGDYRVLYEFDL